MVTRNGVSSSAVSFPVGTFSPGIFTTTANGAGKAWAINAVTGVVAQPAGSITGLNASPAKAGDHLYENGEIMDADTHDKLADVLADLAETAEPAALAA